MPVGGLCGSYFVWLQVREPPAALGRTVVVVWSLAVGKEGRALYQRWEPKDDTAERGFQILIGWGWDAGAGEWSGKLRRRAPVGSRGLIFIRSL